MFSYPPGWRRPYLDEDVVKLCPESKWKATGQATIGIHVFVPLPVAGKEGNQDASVNLHVPFSGKLGEKLTESLRPLVPKNKRWQHITDSEEGETLPEYPMFKWVPYESFGSAGGFDTTSFFDEITGSVNEILQLEGEIDRLFEEAKASIKNRPQHKRPKKSAPQH
jgi:hypothetical protein